MGHFEDEVTVEMVIGGPTKTCKVTINMEHKNATYRITTSNRYYLGNDGKIKGEKPYTNILKADPINGAIDIPPQKVEEEIDNILGKQLKDFFFYDGENNKIENITNSKKAFLKDAISKIIGIDRIETLKSYYDENYSNTVISKLKNKLSMTEEIDASDLKNEIEDIIKEISSYKTQLTDLQAEILRLKDQYEEKEALITGSKDVIEKQTEKINAEKELNNERKKRLPALETLQLTFNGSNSFLKALFSYNFKKYNLDKLLSEAKFTTNTSYKYINEQAIDQFIAMGRCVCGTPIVKDGEVYKHLIESKNHMEPHDFGKYASDFADSEKQNSFFSNQTLSNIQDRACDLNSIIEKIEDTDDLYKRLQKELEGRPDVGEYQSEATKLRDQIMRKEGEYDFIENNIIPSKERLLSEKQAQLDSLTEETDENDFIWKCIEYSRHIVGLLDKRINSSKKEARLKLENLVDGIFQEMYSYPGQRRIHIDNNFIASCDLVSGKTLEKSTGLKTVQNYAFVAGLMELIREKIVPSDVADQIEDTNYPLVMDAPFSSTDDEHIANICRILPKYSNQIIICVMRKDFGTAKIQIEDRIGKEYTINKISESSSVAEEV